MQFEQKMVALENKIEAIKKEKKTLVGRAKTALLDRKTKLFNIQESTEKFVYRVERLYEKIKFNVQERSRKKEQVQVEHIASLDKFIEKYEE